MAEFVSEYRADKRLSQSDIKQFLKEGSARWSYQKRIKKQPTESMIKGNALHVMCLEGQDEFMKRFIVDEWNPKTDGSRNTKAFKEHSKALQQQADEEHKVILKREQYLHMVEVREYLSKHLGGIVHNKANLFEHSLYGEFSGVPFKGQLDIYRPERAIIDLKFTERVNIAHDHQLNRLVTEDRWDIQAAAYIDLVKQNYGQELPFIFVVIEHLEKPFNIRLVEISDSATPEVLENARVTIRSSLNDMTHIRDVEEYTINKKPFIPNFPAWLS